MIEVWIPYCHLMSMLSLFYHDLKSNKLTMRGEKVQKDKWRNDNNVELDDGILNDFAVACFPLFGYVMK